VLYLQLTHIFKMCCTYDWPVYFRCVVLTIDPYI